VSPPVAVSPIKEKIQEVKISSVAKSHGPKSNALVYAERAVSTYIFNFIHHQVVAHKKKKQYKHN